MRIYLVRIYRPETKSNVYIHVEADNCYNLTKFASTQLNGWEVRSYILCNCPQEAYIEYKGVKIWKDKKLALLPGEINTVKLSCSDFSSIKKEVQILCIV